VAVAVAAPAAAALVAGSAGGRGRLGLVWHLLAEVVLAAAAPVAAALVAAGLVVVGSGGRGGARGCSVAPDRRGFDLGFDLCDSERALLAENILVDT